MATTKAVFLCVLLTSLPPLRGASEPSPPLQVMGGSIVGTVETSAQGRSYYAYRAIPYAGSPAGQERFKPPPELEPWTGVLSTAQAGPYCAQSGRGYTQGQEDCLHASVYTPQLPQEGAPLLPVLVWLPGGGFIVSGAADYDPSLLMDKDIVVVVPQYRLGMLGFLYAMDSSPGNYGMLDQVAALRWVQANIAHFGGDPSQVILGGDSSGGASALYHMISPLSEGLFHGVVSMSGSPLSSWARHFVQRQSRLLFALRMGCPRYSSEAMVSCFRDLPIEKLLPAQAGVLKGKIGNGPDLLFTGNNNQAPMVQVASYGDEFSQFIVNEPLVTFGQGNFAEVPVLIMGAKDEGNYLIEMVINEWAVQEAAKDDTFNDAIVTVLAEKTGVNPKDKRVMQMIWDQYFPDTEGKSYQEKIPGIAQMAGDSLYNGGLIYMARYLNDKVPTFLLRFDFEDGPHYQQFNRSDPTAAPPIAPGAGHLDQLNYFFPKKFEPFTTPEQKMVSKTTLDIIDNFVNGRTPSEGWKNVTDEGLEAAVITPAGELVQGSFMVPDRVRAAEMFLQHQQRNALGLLKRLLRAPRDEL